MVDLRIDVAVVLEEIQPTVVVVIEEAGSEPQIGERSVGDPGGRRDLGKNVAAQAAPQVVRPFGEVRYKEARPSLVEVVAKVDSHGRHGSGVLRVGDASGRTDVGERAVAIVVQEPGGLAVIAD